MNSPKPLEVKICGLDRPESVAAAAAAGADYIGFAFYPRSPRNLSPARAAEIIGLVPEGVVRVGFFVDPSDEQIDSVLGATPLDLLQLHGGETPDRVGQIKERTRLPVMKVISVAGAADLERADDFRGIADRFLFDAKPPTDMTDALPGGNALMFDWQLLSERRIDTPWMLAGGLTDQNVAQAIQISGARAVDVSSGVEDRPGVKNVDKIQRFISAVRSVPINLQTMK